MNKRAEFLDIKGLELYDFEIKKYIKKNGGGATSLFINGLGENSIQARDMNSTALGDYSVAIGKDTIAGIKGFYIKAIDATNKHIYLQMAEYNPAEKPVFLSPEETSSEPNADYFDNSFTGYDNIDFESGEEYYCCIKNHFYYIYKCKIVGVNKNCLTYEGELGFTEFYDSTSSVNYSLWIPKYSPEQGAFIIGAASHTEGYETIATHDYSHAEGWASVAAGRFGHAEGNRTVAGASSHAEGQRTKALGENCHAEGSQTTAYANMSHAEGYLTVVSGEYGHAEGKLSEATGLCTHAEGGETKASGSHSHAEGYQTQSTGSGSHAEGNNNIAEGTAAHAEGHQTEASGSYAHTEGYDTHATAQGAHAEGNMSQAIGVGSHAEGGGTLAQGTQSHAEGVKTQALGQQAHAEGNNTIAVGDFSHSEGRCTIANGRMQHVQGKFNIEDKSGIYADIVGGGNSDADRKNIRTLDWNGNAWYAGEVKVGTNKEKLATETVVDTKIANLINSAPKTLDTLNEIAAALGNDPNFATTILNQLGLKADTTYVDGQISGVKSRVVALENVAIQEVKYEDIDIASTGIYIITDKHVDGYDYQRGYLICVSGLGEYFGGSDYLQKVQIFLDTDGKLKIRYNLYDITGPIYWTEWEEFLTTRTLKSEVENIIYQPPVTELPTTLKVNQKYNFGERENLSLAFPTNAQDGDVVYLTFESGETPTTLTIDTTNTTDIEIIPEANCYYEIFGSFNGKIWLVNYSEYLVSEV